MSFWFEMLIKMKWGLHYILIFFDLSIIIHLIIIQINMNMKNDISWKSKKEVIVFYSKFHH